MFQTNLGDLSRLIEGRLLRGRPKTVVRHAAFGYTKSLRTGVVFFFHPQRSAAQQLNALRQKSSSGVIVPPSLASRVPRHHPVIVVKNPLRAIWRVTQRQRKLSRAQFIGVTGSSGKTTTKEMLASILSRQAPTLKSHSNNNLFASMPSNLIPLNGSHRYAVLEMGMASLGNIRNQCSVAKPSIGVVTQVKEAHVGSLGSSLNNVVRAKQELVDGVKPGGLLVLNADDPGSRRLSLARFRGKVITIGIKNQATLRASRIHVHRNGTNFRVGNRHYQIPIWGRHNVYNALAAIAVARHLKVPPSKIAEGLRRFSPPYMRLQPVRGKKKTLLINDAYNANPTSMIAGLRVLKQVGKGSRTFAVLGDMHELGSHSQSGHARVGKIVARLKPDHLITVGPRAATIARQAVAKGYPRHRAASFPLQLAPVRSYIVKRMTPGSVLYFKASRKVSMENLVRALRA
ncbi:UDP-N-acetylmuramoyl-tripeptide--D-alanyl-D-alanine ligase [Desmospora profundinema]|uniref:UDP-N-acetylmuramoyl-tripeptide--D-alanyl-D-alanine ligase n=1 Tax=Desmospora profundinema TaxID=1571184 RepID=A0ABU1IKG9_9BACL|nr:UDP-N-acetylmuramoyl-tripeptide--D-alanyl-D-alanine ligase [Desmospora profundinema]MDR6224305.1 UDP-N-acetylmuramoyl-tripeptide--D-alanyl-D-alanine ligase [Desmospora profundinema]